MTRYPDIPDLPFDPIGEVQRALETSYTDDYLDPLSGDWLSDDLGRAIDLTTCPGPLSPSVQGQLDRSIGRLNGQVDYVAAIVGRFGLSHAYDQTADQINAINASNPTRRGVRRMLSPLDTETTQ